MASRIAHQLQKAFREGKFEHFVEVRCARCDRVEELHQGPNTDTTDPDQLRKRMLSKGWEFDAFRKKNCICPECQKDQRDLDEEEPKMPKPTLVAANSEPTMPQQAAPPRTSLTSDERFKVRQLLDQHFDDKMGAYLNQYSDQRIGTELEVPWKLVFDIREAAYGPIREDPRIAAIRSDMAKLERQMSELTRGMTDLRTKIGGLK